MSTIGYERRTNPFLRHPDFASFRSFVVDGAPPVPAHYPRLKEVNAAGAEILHRLPTVPGLPPHDFQRTSREAGVVVLDTRQMLAFGGGHVPGAINIGDRPELSTWVGQMFDPEQRFLLIVDHDDEIEEIVRRMIRTGYTQFGGYLTGGMRAWENAGLPLAQLPQMSVQALRARIDDGDAPRIIDVRSPDEYREGCIPGAESFFVADMRHRITGLDKSAPIVAYCASGYRASLATSLMKSRGFACVYNVPGSWKAWRNAGYPVEEGPPGDRGRGACAAEWILIMKSVILISAIGLSLASTAQAQAATPDPRAYSGAAWSPYVVGASIGLLSLLTLVFSNKLLGASTAYARVAGLLAKPIAPKRVASLAFFREKAPKITWQVMLIAGVIGGSFLAAWTGGELSGRWLPEMWAARFGPDSVALRLGVAFTGGALLAFGARTAGGCTSGHGISGALQLSIGSWLAAISFFIGGIVVAQLLF